MGDMDPFGWEVNGSDSGGPWKRVEASEVYTAGRTPVDPRRGGDFRLRPANNAATAAASVPLADGGRRKAAEEGRE